MMKLTTIRFSHYNEKARWVLDRFCIPYEEFPLLPGIHFPVTWKAARGKGRADKFSTKFSTPILLTDRDETLCDSASIVQYVSSRFADEQSDLFWHPEVEAMAGYFDAKLAPLTRTWGYYHALSDRKLMRELAYANVGPMQATLFMTVLPAVRKLIFTRFRITPERVKTFHEHICGEFKRVEERMRDGRKYLLGDRFSAADLAFACASAPALLVRPGEGYGALLPPLERAHPKAREFAHELRSSVAGQFVLRLFREERGEQMIPTKPKVR